MTRRRKDDDEILASRVGDLEMLRIYEEARRDGLRKRADALRDFARQAEQRQRAALGVIVTRRAQ